MALNEIPPASVAPDSSVAEGASPLPTVMSRRKFLQCLGVVGTGLILGGCPLSDDQRGKIPVRKKEVPLRDGAWGN